MKKLLIVVCLVILATACEKEQNAKPKIENSKLQEDCGQCTGTWDLTDTIP